MKPMMTDLNRLLARQNFKDEKEMQEFLNSLADKSLYDLPKMDLTPEEQAQDLVYEAFEIAPAKAKKNIEKAMELDPDCIEAYEYLASREKKLENVLKFFDKGIAIGRKKFGGKFLKQNKGIFWGIHETRAFMRCLLHKAEIFMMEDKTAESVAIMEELMELNKGDNQGVRFPLLVALVALGDTEKFKKYDKMFADDKDSAQLLYTRALFAFKTEGDSANARKMLENSFKKNPFVVQKLFDENFQVSGVQSYSLGSPEEAEVYLSYSIMTWYTTEGAMDWVDKIIYELISKEPAKKTRISKK
jgi:tetratricopeptide (TPR) repeat protein